MATVDRMFYAGLDLPVQWFSTECMELQLPPGRPRNVWLNRVQEDANALLLSIRCGDLRSPWVTERRKGSLRLRDDDDDDGWLVSKMEGKTNF